MLSTANTGHSLLYSLRPHFSNLSEENSPILQVLIDVPNLTTEQVNEDMDVVPEDRWNVACCGFRNPVHSFFTYPHLTTVRRIFFVYRYFRHQGEANPISTKCYM